MARVSCLTISQKFVNFVDTKVHNTFHGASDRNPSTIFSLEKHFFLSEAFPSSFVAYCI